ncbi:SusC/RagA family TonB-linked outer membrane protein [Paradesertivirga mongoliensis]|uniref:SusC/RagA family TonB-linked outer membrane protein n=1 Tax=Paradesertivirga mongoliensis TaxID=2100740 RepID=A0ABW4ZK06_9SPHI|nr:TonB-dependent receptor [Pedobacter mongoliensis]
MNRGFLSTRLRPEWIFFSQLWKKFLVILLVLLQANVFAQSNIRVTGTVTDPKGETLPGVSIKVKGEATGVTSSNDGKFSIVVPSQASVLVFSYIGSITKEEVVGSRTIINVALQDNTTGLDEVVITGYGQAVKRRDLTGSISSVTAAQIEERQPVTLFDALQGQAAGVLVTNDSGDPAGQGTIQIRNASTIGGSTAPLYVIDGALSDNANFVNPQDIASIEVLKDASSAAIYGARGANGVILITTKRGKEGRPLISANYTNTMGKLAHKLRLTSADELRYFRQVARGNNPASDTVNPYLNSDNDYQDLLYRTGRKQVMSLNLSGGTKGATYYAGFTYTDDKATIVNSWMKRVQSTINADFDISRKLKISNSLAFAYQTGNNVPIGTSARQVFERNPWTSIYRPDGSLASYVESKRNPVAFALLAENIDNNYTTKFNTNLTYTLNDRFRFTTVGNAQLDNNANNQFETAQLTSGGGGNAVGRNTFEKRIRWEAQGLLNYAQTFAEDHSVTGLLGVSAERRRDDDYTIRMNGYLTEEIRTSNAGVIDLSNDNTRTGSGAYSTANIFGRLNYSYLSRYILQGSFRRDGSSRFGGSNKWGTFLSGSAAWRFSDENFMAWSKKFLSDAKLRYSIGTVGNDQIANYASYTTMQFGGSYAGLGAAFPNTTLGNSNIQWESTTTADYGLELSFFKSRMNFVTSYYTKTTEDLLYEQEIPKETGARTTTVNFGTIANSGLEFELSGNPVAKRDFSWNARANISFQKGKIKELAGGTSKLVNNVFLIEEGGQIGNILLWQNLGVYQYDVSNAYDAQGRRLTPEGITVDEATNTSTATGYSIDGQPYSGTIYKKSRNGIVLQGGDTEWLDTNNDHVIDDNDLVIAGNMLPDFYFGISNDFRYKSFSLNIMFNGQFGNKVYNQVANSQNANTSTYTPPMWDAATTSWKRQGDITKFPLITRTNTRGSISSGYNSMYLEDGSFIRLQSLRFAYQLKPSIAQKVKLKNAQLYVFGTNLAMWTNYSGYDPEFSSNNPLVRGIDNGRYPKRREFGLGLNVNF